MNRYISALLASWFAACGLAADWNGFRGPNGSGVAETAGLPARFDSTTNVIWKVTLPAGNSSPVLTNDRVFLTGSEDGKLLTLCLNRENGNVLWARHVPPGRSEPRHKLNSAASSTPVTDGENVYVFFPEFGLISYASDGTERWRRSLGPFSNLHGMAASPILSDHKLILVCDQDNDSYVLAVNKDTGQTIWRTERPEVVHGFATPTIFPGAGAVPQLIVPGSYQVVAYSLATGRKLWWVHGLTWQVKTTAVVNKDTVFVSGWAPGGETAQSELLPSFEEVVKESDKNGDKGISAEELPVKWKHGGSWDFIDLNRDGVLDAREWDFYRARRSAHNVTMAIRPGSAKGDLTGTHVLWRYDRSVPQVSSPLLYKGVFYTIKDGGIFTALDPERGTVLKQARLPEAMDAYYASPVAADGKIFLIGEAGKVSVLSAGPEWETISVNDFDEPCYATPAISDGRIYLRTRTSLYCLGRTD